MVAYLRFELVRLLRNRSLLIVTIMLPLVVYVVFAGPADRMSDLDDGVPVATMVMVIMAGWAAMLGALSIGSGVAEERANGWLQQLRTTPLPPSRVVVAKAVVSTLPAILAVVAIGAAATLLYGVTLRAGHWLMLATAMWLGTAPFAVLGLAIGYLASRQLAGPVVTITWLALALLGGLMTSVDSFPEWLQPISRAMPTYRYAELGWRAAEGTLPGAPSAGLLVGWTVLFGLLAGWGYRRSSAIR